MATVLITGAASGIGRAAATCFAANGWRCLLVDRNGEALQQVLADVEALAPRAAESDGLRHEIRCIDLTDAQQIASLADLSGPIDAVINNAGMSDTSGVPLTEQAPQRQAALAALNLAAPLAVVAALQSKLAPRARIVNVASGAGLRAIPFRGYYSATKAGLIAQSRALAQARPELAVTVLCPGFVRTELVASLIAAGRLDARQAVAKIPLGRMAEPAEMAEMMRFLASPGAAAISGQVLALCGGSSIYGGSRVCDPATAAPLPMDMPLALTVTGDAAGQWADSLRADVQGETTLLPQAAATTAAQQPTAYPGVVDVSALQAVMPGSISGSEVPGTLAIVHEAARRFAAQHARDASLTILLPADYATADEPGRVRPGRVRPGHVRPSHAGSSGDAASLADWRSAGDAAAARMLIATLACELAPRALRVNAVEVSPGIRPEHLRPLLHTIAGARAQFLTGQTLRACAA